MDSPHDAPPCQSSDDDLRHRAEYLLKRRGPDAELQQLSDAELRREVQLQRIERTLQRQQIQELHQRHDASPVGLLVMTTDGVIENANLLAAELLGASRDRLIESSLFDFLHASSRSVVDEHRQQLFDSAGVRQDLITIQLPTEAEVELALFSRPMISDDGDCRRWHAAIWDLRSFCQQDHQQRQNLEQQLHINHRMETLGRLANGIAHDFNNLLTLIIGYAKLVLNQLPDDDPIYPHLLQIHKAGNHAGDLIEQLLAYSSDADQNCSGVDINALLRDLESMFDRLIGDEIQLHLHLQPDSSPADFHRSHLQQVLLNLVVNARDAIDDVGHIYIRTDTVDIDAATAHDHDIPPGAYHLIEVEDDGCGISSDDLSQIFDPFFTTKETQSNRGFGLSTTHGLLRRHGAAIEVDSQYQKGTRFRVFLPIASDHQTDDQSPDKPPTVLVVDDRPDLRDFASLVIRDMNLDVLSASSATDALQMARSCGPQLKLIISDVTMPQMSGPELHTKICEYLPDTPAIFMSGYDRQTLEQEHGLLAHAHFLEKPFDPGDLEALTQQLLNLGP